MKTIKYSVDQLNNMSIHDLKILEDDLWNYRKTVCTVLAFQKAVEDEN